MQRFFVFFVKWVWPVLRQIVNRNSVLRCATCIQRIAPSSYDGFDELCAECRSYKLNQKHKPLLIDNINNLIHEIDFHEEILELCVSPPFAHKPDFIFMLSGGKDSCYALKRFKNTYPHANIRCVFVDTGLYPVAARRNCESMCAALSIPLIIVNNNSIREKIREGLLKLKDLNYEYNPIDFLDGSLIFQEGERVAIEMGVKNIVCGMSITQVKTLVKPECVYKKVNEKSMVWFPMAVWNPTESEIHGSLRRTIPHASFDVVSTNNILIPTLCALDVMKNGYCSFEKEMSCNIREGRADRTYYLHLFECLAWMTRKGWMKKEINKTLAMFDLTLSDIV